MYSISTLGSIVGTFLVSFILVEFLGTKLIIWSVAVVLLGTAGLCFLGNVTKGAIATAAVAVLRR